MATILSKISAIFIIMAVGFALNKSKMIPSSAIPPMITLLVWITTPCLIYTSITTREYNPDILTSTIEMFIMSLLYFALTLVLGFLLCKHLFKVPGQDLGVYVASFPGINNGFMGYPVTQAIFGQHLFYYMIMFNIVLNVYIYSVCPLIIHMGEKGHKFNAKGLIKTIANPSTIICVVSMVMLINGLQLPSFLFESIEMIGEITVPLSMLVLGMQLAESKVMAVFKNYKLVIISALKMLLIPAGIFLMFNWLPIATEVKLITVFGAAFPCAVIISAIVQMEKKNAQLAAEMVALTTLMSVITIPVIAMFLSSYYGL